MESRIRARLGTHYLAGSYLQSPDRFTGTVAHYCVERRSEAVTKLGTACCPLFKYICEAQHSINHIGGTVRR